MTQPTSDDAPRCIDCGDEMVASSPGGRCRDCDHSYLFAAGSCRECLRWIIREDIGGPVAEQHVATCTLRASGADCYPRDEAENLLIRQRKGYPGVPPLPLTYPAPTATRAEVDAWYKAHAPPPEPPHEAPPVANGPSPVCSACGVVRIKAVGPPFCDGCRRSMDI